MKNQKGFSALETLLVLVIIGLTGFVGWYVWNARNSADKSLDSASGNNLKVLKNTPIEDVGNTGPTPTGWKVYKDPTYKFSFAYPADWVIHTDTFKSGDSADGSIYFANANEVNHGSGSTGFSVYVSDLSFAKLVRAAKGEEFLQKNTRTPKKYTGTEASVKKGNYSGVRLTPTEWDASAYYFQVGQHVFHFPAEYYPDTTSSQYDTYKNITKSIVLLP
jgi:type II secretory pathway pseudopilin PulG